jgi:outer membrane protein assembly factor BamB
VTPGGHRVDILGVGFDALDLGGAVAEIERRLDEGRRTFVITANPEFVMLASRAPDVAALAPTPSRPDDVRPVHFEWRTRFSPNGATLVVDHKGGVGFWDVARGAIGTFVDATELLAFFAKGARVLVRSGDSLIALSTEDGAEVWRVTLPHNKDERAHVADDVGVLLVGQRSAGDVVALAMNDGRERYRLAGVRVAVHDRDVLVEHAAGLVDLLDREVDTGELGWSEERE